MHQIGVYLLYGSCHPNVSCLKRDIGDNTHLTHQIDLKDDNAMFYFDRVA
ncbi:hypothetical protein [Macrococcus sp. 18KM445]